MVTRKQKIPKAPSGELALNDIDKDYDIYKKAQT
jgi:hypothetical protein